MMLVLGRVIVALFLSLFLWRLQYSTIMASSRDEDDDDLWDSIDKAKESFDDDGLLFTYFQMRTICDPPIA